MSVRDFEARPVGEGLNSERMLRWFDSLSNRQNIDLQQELTSVASGDELLIFDVSETGDVKTKKITVSNLTALVSGGITTLVAPTNFPSANSVDIQNIPQNYSALLLVVNGLSFDTATRALRMRISSDNGSTVNTGGFAGTYVNNTTVTAAGGGSSPIAPGSQTAAQTTTTLVLITGYQSGSYANFQCSGLDASTVDHSSNTTFVGNTSAINCLRLIMNSTGNFDAGTYALYGVS